MAAVEAVQTATAAAETQVVGSWRRVVAMAAVEAGESAVAVAVAVGKAEAEAAVVMLTAGRAAN